MIFNFSFVEISSLVIKSSYQTFTFRTHVPETLRHENFCYFCYLPKQLPIIK
jgi:hypothetical protein